MRVLGLIGGMSWESTAIYYRLINEDIKQRLGGHHSAKLVLYNVDFAEIEELQHRGDWQSCARILADAATRLERAGAECVVLCTNTMHKVASEIAASVRIPLLHIADATGTAIVATGLKRVGLLGTRFTMEQDFYRDRLASKFSLDVLTPSAPEREIVHRVIYDELVHGRCLSESRQAYQRIVDALVERGAQGIIFGCTEIGLLLDAQALRVPGFETATLHAASAVEFALADRTAT